MCTQYTRAIIIYVEARDHSRVGYVLRKPSIEGVHGIRPKVTLDVMPNSPFVSQANTKQFGRRM